MTKFLLAVVFGALLATNLSACTKEAELGDAAKPAKAASTAGAAPATEATKPSEPAKKEEKAPAKKEKACIDKVKDGKPVIGKDGKPEQVCKEVKIHEKLDGHKVPDKK